MGAPTFSELAMATFCPRKLYYRRRDRRSATPAATESIVDLAFRYPELLGPDGRAILADAPIRVSPTRYLVTLRAARDRLDAWPALAEPAGTDVHLTGRECRGIAHKVLEAPLAPSIVSPGRPPDDGVWRPQTVKAVAAAKALAWERQAPVRRAYLEYPAHGVVRTVELTARRKAAYRAALRTVRSMDGPPRRTRDTAKCTTCTYRGECGPRTWSLRSLLG